MALQVGFRHQAGRIHRPPRPSARSRRTSRCVRCAGIRRCRPPSSCPAPVRRSSVMFGRPRTGSGCPADSRCPCCRPACSSACGRRRNGRGPRPGSPPRLNAALRAGSGRYSPGVKLIAFQAISDARMSYGNGSVFRFTGLRYRRQRPQEREDRVGVGAGDLRVVRIREGRVQMGAVRALALVHGAIEIVRRPGADAGLRVGREVGGVDVAERRLERRGRR